MKITFLGASQEVGKSCFLVECEVKLLLDAGIMVNRNNETPHLANVKADALVISHAHLDHSGAAPMLFKHHPIPAFTTFPTLPLVSLLWADSEKIALLNKQTLPYSSREVERLLKNAVPLPYGSEYKFYEGTSFKLLDAGHILGSSQVLVRNEKTLLYTGDFKPEDTRLHSAAKPPEEEVDVLVTESTYGAREHPERKKLEDEFCDAVEQALEKDEPALLPCFAVGRAQEILMVLHAHRINADIYLDGMAKTVSSIMTDFPSYLKKPAALKNALERAKFIESREQRKSLTKRPCVIISSAGMCLHPDSIIQQADGACRRISEVQSEVYTANNGRVCTGNVSRLVVNPSPKELVEIRTQTTSLRGTPSHEFMVLEGLKTGWKRADALRKGDYVALAKKVPYEGTEQDLKISVLIKNEHDAKKARLPAKTSPELSQFLGYFIGDGDVKQNKIVRLTDKDVDNLKHYAILAEQVFGVKGVIETKERNRLLIYSSRIARFLEAIENARSPKRRVPEVIQKASMDSIAAFLRGLFDAEGTVSSSTNSSVAFYSSSRDIADTSQALLLRFGIRAENRVLTKRTGGKMFTGRMVRINNPRDLKNFAEKIGFSSNAKKKKLEDLLTRIGGGYSHAEMYSITRAELRAMAEVAAGRKRIPRVFAKKYELTSSCNKHCTRRVLEGVAKELSKLGIKKAEDLAAEINLLLESDIAFTKILDVKPSETDTASVFDLTLPATSNYIANGLIVHNCDGGPALSYLKKMNENGEGTVLLTGYQVEGSNGRALLDGKPVNFNGTKTRVNLPVKHFDFSAHASKTDLVEYAKTVNPSTIFCVHGDKEGCDSLVSALKAEGFKAKAPVLGERVEV
ncbi:MBL fold metallo-hydrolase [Candidatus Micrarchaeota archaeon]|nr:MBL fold metallo-hydrolase [Candidatus Micrarchaeota archaeon]